MRVTKHAQDETFTVGADAVWPSIVFETDGPGPHVWRWTIAWDTFTVSGTATTPGNRWDATQAVADRGGTLTVNVSAGAAMSAITGRIKGTNPSAADVTRYIVETGKGDGFERIVAHETQFRHFAGSG